MYGGSLLVSEIQAFLEASYQQPSPDSLNGCTLDKALSGLYGKVYFNNDL